MDARRELKRELQDLHTAPFRTLNDFVLDANWNVPDISNFPRLNNRIVSNLIYYQTNYFVFGVALFLLVGINYPVDFLFGLVVVASLLMGFVYLSSSDRVGNDALGSAKRFLSAAKQDRPIVVLLLVLVASYFILSIVGKLFIFLFGIVLPVQAIILHAALRKRNVLNKVANKMDQFGIRSTPMGIFLAALGLQSSSLLNE